MKLAHRVEKRRNVYAKHGIEYALQINLSTEHGGDSGWWKVAAFTKEPSEEELLEILRIIIRGMEVHHNYQNRIRPSFDVTIV